jgi:branched-chain amino acid transport system ATP-binding protein
MLKLNNIEVVYSDVIQVLRGVSIDVPDGKIVGLLGANGAGKSTTLKAISGLLRTQEGEVNRGSIEFDGQRTDRLSPEKIVQLGVVQVLEGRRLFRHLTVEENLLLGGLARRSASRRSSVSQEQMLVIGRALMAHPKLMLLDEPSLGLAPLLVKEIFRVISEISADEGMAILLVEQNARMALSVADYAYVMEDGRVVLDGPSEQLAENEDIKEFYLGLTQVGERKSYRQVKHYKRRKRWLG